MESANPTAKITNYLVLGRPKGATVFDQGKIVWASGARDAAGLYFRRSVAPLEELRVYPLAAEPESWAVVDWDEMPHVAFRPDSASGLLYPVAPEGERIFRAAEAGQEAVRSVTYATTCGAAAAEAWFTTEGAARGLRSAVVAVQEQAAGPRTWEIFACTLGADRRRVRPVGNTPAAEAAARLWEILEPDDSDYLTVNGTMLAWAPDAEAAANFWAAAAGPAVASAEELPPCQVTEILTWPEGGVPSLAELRDPRIFKFLERRVGTAEPASGRPESWAVALEVADGEHLGDSFSRGQA